MATFGPAFIVAVRISKTSSINFAENDIEKTDNRGHIAEQPFAAQKHRSSFAKA